MNRFGADTDEDVTDWGEESAGEKRRALRKARSHLSQAAVDRLTDVTIDLLREHKMMLDGLRDAKHAMEDQDIFGDDPRITAAINKIGDVIRAVAPESV